MIKHKQKTRWHFLLLIIVTVSVSCNKQPIGPPIDNPVNPTDKYLGNHQVMNTHITGLHTVYDSVGVLIDIKEDTTLVLDSIFITTIAGSDSVLVDGLLRSFNHDTWATNAVVENDSLRINYDKSNQSHSNWISGKIWVAGDSIFLDYMWNNSDTWTQGALPSYGKVTARGSK